jgi:UDP-N-acetylmuramoyl-L-alanyl-D-glutamate--2,6-diaminopimelate ligase
VIGITGTDGKTTTSYLVDHILTRAGVHTGLIGTVGIVSKRVEYAAPTPDHTRVQPPAGYFREMVERGATHAVIEATSHGLAMHRIDGTVVAIAGVTNMTHEHLEYHKTVRILAVQGHVRRAGRRSNGVVVLNNDDPGAMSAVPYASGRGQTFSAKAPMRLPRDRRGDQRTRNVVPPPCWRIQSSVSIAADMAHSMSTSPAGNCVAHAAESCSSSVEALRSPRRTWRMQSI